VIPGGFSRAKAKVPRLDRDLLERERKLQRELFSIQVSKRDVLMDSVNQQHAHIQAVLDSSIKTLHDQTDDTNVEGVLLMSKQLFAGWKNLIQEVQRVSKQHEKSLLAVSAKMQQRLQSMNTDIPHRSRTVSTTIFSVEQTLQEQSQTVNNLVDKYI
jgi:hypothetical protein